MNRVVQPFVWLSRIHCCRGFGIQSPTDYAFVRYVVNEHWPYYAYEKLGAGDDWLRRKLGRLYFRLANWRQPKTVVDRVRAKAYIKAGCCSADIKGDNDHIELALLPIEDDYKSVFSRCDSSSVVVLEQICHDKKRWQQAVRDERVTISFDLYYCGILMFDQKRTKQHYKINF